MEIDYKKNESFWRDVTSQAKKGLDYVAGQNPIIPEHAHLRFRAAQMEFLFDKVLPGLPRELDVLDVGCGPGTWALQLAPKVKSVHGLDIAPAFIEHANKAAAEKNLPNASFEVASFMEYQTERRFGLVILGAMLVYINDQDLVPFFSKVRSFLAPGGVVYARTSVAPRRPYTRKGRYQGIYRTKAQYEDAFARAGFTVTTERDYAYTDASLAAVYFGAANLATLGTLRRFEGAGAKLYDALERGRSFTFDRARRLLDLTPAPICYHFFLTPNR